MPGINVFANLFADGFLGGINKMIGGLKKVTKTMSLAAKVTTGFGLAIGAIGIIHVRNSIREFIKFEQQLAELAKVMNDMDAAKAVARDIGELSRVMPVASEEMFNVAATAARLGIRGVANISEFTRVATMMGAATDLAADQAADAFARIMKQTDTPVREFETLGSVVNELSNNMATTTKEIVESVRRSAPELAKLGFSANEIAALSSSLNEVSESSTRAGTRLRRLAQDLGDPRKVAAFAEAIGEIPEDFHRMLRTDPVGTLQRIIKVFGEGGAAAQKLSTQIDSRVRLALAALSQNAEGTTLALEIMRDQIAGPDSLEREFNIFADTTQGAMQKVQNSVDELQRRTGEKVIIMKRNLEELKLAFLDLLIPDLDPLAAFASPQQIRAFKGRIRQALVEAADEASEVEFTPSGTAIFVRSEGLEEANREILDLVEEGLKDLEFGGQSAFRVIDYLLTPAIQRLGDEATIAQIKMEQMNIARDVVDHFRGMAAAADGASKDTQHFADDLLQEFIEMAHGVEEGTVSWEKFNSFAQESIRVIYDRAKADKDGKRDLELYNEEVQEFIDSARLQVIEMEHGARAAFVLGDMYLNAGSQAGKLLEAFDRLEAARANKAMRDENERIQMAQAQSLEDQQLGLRDLIDQTYREIAVLRALDPERKKQIERQQEINALREEFPDVTGKLYEAALAAIRERHAQEDLAEAYKKTAAEREKARERQEKLNERIRDMQLLTTEAQFDFLTRSLERMGDSAVDAFNKIIDGSAGAGEAIIGMIRDIANELLRRQIVGALFRTFLSTATPALGDAGHGVSFDDLHPTPRASGGPLRTGQLAMVGEEGPELFVPRVNGTIVPNDELRGSGGGDTYNVNHHFTIQALDSRGVREILAKEKQFITGLTMDSVSRSRNLKKFGLN